MNEDMIKQLKEEEKHRKQHPFWVWESIQSIPELLSLCLQKEITDQISHVAQTCIKKNINKIVLLGRGSSYFVTLAERFFIEKVTKIPVICDVTNVFESYPYYSVNENTAVFFHSHSGKSEGDVKVVEIVKSLGAYSIGVTDILNSNLAQVTDDVIIGPGGSKVELPATRTFTTAMFRMMQFAISLGKELGKNNVIRELEDSLNKMPSQIQEFIPKFEEKAKGIVQQIQASSSFIIAAFGPNLANAEEGAMAFSQSTGVPAQSFEMENYIHGPMQALTSSQCLISMASPGPLQSRIIRMTKAAKIIGAKTVLLAPQGTVNSSDVDVLIDMPAGIPDLVTPLIYMVPLWQIGYYFALLERGGHPDRLSMDKEQFKKGFSYLMQEDKWVTQK